MKELTRDTLWRTREGQILRIRDMEDSHVLNIIRCLRNMSPHGTRVNAGDPKRRREWLNFLANEAYARGLELDPLTEDEPVHE
jgi:hypothetical protein